MSTATVNEIPGVANDAPEIEATVAEDSPAGATQDETEAMPVDPPEAAATVDESTAEDEPPASQQEPQAELESKPEPTNASLQLAHIQRLQSLRISVRIAEFSLEDAKATVKERKEVYEHRIKALLEAIDEGPDRLPLFTQPKAEGEQQMAAASADPGDQPTQDESSSVAAVDSEAWREATLSDLNITGKLAESLTEAGLTTMGAIADWSSAGKLLTDIPGVGPAKAEKIEEATARYWAERSQAAGDEETAIEEEEHADPANEGDDEHLDGSYQSAYQEGRQACKDGIPSMQNPYEGTDARSAWNAGWNAEFAADI